MQYHWVPLERRVEESLQKANCRNVTVLAAVSGGADSMFMLHMLQRCRQHLGLNVHVATIDHGVREDSHRDLEFVRETCEQYDLPWHGVTLVHDEYDRWGEEGLEGTLRSKRYTHFLRIADAIGATFVLTAHTFTDDTETILMNIARGTGLNGLGGIPWLRFLENSSIRVLRPMLDIDRDDVRTWMESKGLPWREDPTNADTSILRNRVRLKVIPVLRSELAWDIDRKLASLASVADEITSTGGLWSAENIRSLVREQTELNISRAATTRIQSLEHMETGSRVDIAYGWSAVRERTGFSVVKPESTASAAIDISIPGVYSADGFTLVHTLVPRAGLTIAPSPWIGYFDASRRSSVLLWRQWERGDGIMPFGMDGPVHVSTLLSNAKVSHAARPFVRVVEDDHELLWVCGVRTSESYRVTDKTTVVRILAIIPSADILS